MLWNQPLIQLCCPSLQLSRMPTALPLELTAVTTPLNSWALFSTNVRQTRSSVSARKPSRPCGWPETCTRSCRQMSDTNLHLSMLMIFKQDMLRSNKNLTVREHPKRLSKRLLRCTQMLSNKDVTMRKNYFATNTSSLSSWRTTLEPFHHFVFLSF